MWTHLVRHAVAERRTSWSQPDELRPLDQRGFHQAERLPTTRDWSGVTSVLSSPALRCRQTVAPLAAVLGLAVEDSAALAEGADGTAALRVIETHRDGDLVLCSHGDVIPEMLRLLVLRGTVLPAEQRWKKGSTWSIEHADGRFVRALYSPAPG